MTLKLSYLPGETPLDPDEMDGLLIHTVSCRGELDEFEQLNIEEAVLWSMTNHISLDDFLTEKGLTQVHQKMFGHVWSWAGKFRKTNKNIGIDSRQIRFALRDCCDDLKYWIQHASFPPDEIAIRAKHRLVSIHPFANGNGRFSRLVADILISRYLHLSPFSWGKSFIKTSRTRYIDALHRADLGDIKPLLEFARK